LRPKAAARWPCPIDIAGLTELAEARKLARHDGYSSIARLRAFEPWGVPKIGALVDATYFAGLRKAGMPEE
jgi:hypothetical protein